MSNSDSPLEPDTVESIKKRLLQSIMAHMEGRVNRESAEDLQMVDELFSELLQAEHIVLSRVEQKRLYDDLLSSF